MKTARETTALPRRSEQLREVIEERIATGAYAPGQHLDETELATEFAVSRTPIREALIQLNSVGLVKMRPRRGAIVAEVDPKRLCEMFELMAELEAMCGRLAARRLTDRDEADLLAAHDACEGARDNGDPDTYFKLNEVFHERIYAASHNDFLAEQATQLHRRLRPYRRLQLRVRDRLKTSFNEHGDVVRAILAGNGEEAADYLRQHITVQGERFADLISMIARAPAR